MGQGEGGRPPELSSPRDQEGQLASPIEAMPCQATHPVLRARGTLLPAALRTAAAPKRRQGENPSRDPTETPSRCPSVGHERAAVPWPERGSWPLLGPISLLQGAGWAPGQEGGRTGTYLAQEKPISAPVMLCCRAGARPEASAHISVSAGPPETDQA